MPTFDLNEIQRQTTLHHIEHHESLDSTSSLAAELLLNLIPVCPALVLATTQTAGRGRGSNQWWANTGALTFSLVLNPATISLEPNRLSLIALATGVAVRRCVARLVPDGHATIKWPNDLLLNERKVCGILTEHISVEGTAALIIGVGLNVNNSLTNAPEDIRQNATSVYDATGESLNLSTVLISILNEIDACIGDLCNRSMALLSELNGNSILNGRSIAVEAGDVITHGTCRGIDDTGALVLMTESGPTTLIAGSVVEY